MRSPPSLWIGSAISAFGLLIAIPVLLGAEEVTNAVDSVLIVLVTALPFAFLAGLLRSSLSRAGAVNALFARLGRVSARDALAEALGDETLALAYWLPDAGRYVDAQGRAVALPVPGDGRAVTEIERDGEPVAAIVHDPALDDDRELVRTAGSAAALALENERLAAELRARLDDLQATSARLVPPATRRAGAWSATCTTARSSASSRCRSCSTSRAGTRSPTPARRPCSTTRSQAHRRALGAARARARHPSRGAHPARARRRARRARRAGAAAGDDHRGYRPAAPAGRRGGGLLRRHGGADQRGQVRRRDVRRRSPCARDAAAS